MIRCNKDFTEFKSYNSTTNFDSHLKELLATKLLSTVSSELRHVLDECEKAGYLVKDIETIQHQVEAAKLNGNIYEEVFATFLNRAFDILEVLEFYGYEVVKKDIAPVTQFDKSFSE